MESRPASLTLFPTLPAGKMSLQIAVDENNLSYHLTLTSSHDSKIFTGKYVLSKENITLFKNDIEELLIQEFNPPEKHFSSFAYDLVCLSDAKQALSNWESNGVLINSGYLKYKLNLIENLLIMNFFPFSNRSCLIL